MKNKRGLALVGEDGQARGYTMEQIIQSISTKLGLPESSIRSALHSLLSFLRTKTGDAQFEQFLAMVPGAKEFAASAPPAPAAETKENGALFGGLLGAAGGLLGGQAGDLAKILTSLQQAGIPTEKIAPLAQEFLVQAREIAGPEPVDRLLQSFPLLRSLVGDK